MLKLVRTRPEAIDIDESKDLEIAKALAAYIPKNSV